MKWGFVQVINCCIPCCALEVLAGGLCFCCFQSSARLIFIFQSTNRFTCIAPCKKEEEEEKKNAFQSISLIEKVLSWERQEEAVFRSSTPHCLIISFQAPITATTIPHLPCTFTPLHNPSLLLPNPSKWIPHRKGFSTEGKWIPDVCICVTLSSWGGMECLKDGYSCSVLCANFNNSSQEGEEILRGEGEEEFNDWFLLLGLYGFPNTSLMIGRTAALLPAEFVTAELRLLGAWW